jgi:signal transduction histidine kinase
MSSPAQEVRNPQSSIPEPQPQNQSFWTSVRGAIVLAIFCATLIFIISSAADWFMLREHETPRFTIELSDGIASCAIGLLSFQVVRLQQERRQRLRERLEIIAEMNHHVRNALQIISLTATGKDKEEIATIHQSVDRIQWALRELLPKI